MAAIFRNYLNITFIFLKSRDLSIKYNLIFIINFMKIGH